MNRLLFLAIRNSVSMVKKSPSNFWLSAAINVVYYLAQAIFWSVLASHENFDSFMSTDYILVFFVTIALVDNLFLLLFGKSGLALQARVKALKLDAHLLLPVNIPLYYILSTISFEHIVLTLVSFLAFFAVHYFIDSAISAVLIHLALVAMGTVVLAAITWIYRSTTFWSSGLVNVRNSNPCFKVMIRPLDSFSGVTRILFMFVVPALFITGVPTHIVVNGFSFGWLLLQFGMTITLVWLANSIFHLGVKRYARIVT